MVFGIFRSIKKSSKLIKIYKILSDVSMDFDMDTMFKKSREKEKAINDAIELLIEHNYTVIDLEGKWIKKN